MSLPVTEDTPPDMLAGSMDLKVVLPDGQSVKMSIQRGTPMMDLLVQVTTAHCLSPGDYSLQAMGDKGVLPFKPNTPIGALDTFTVKIVEKKLHTRGRAPQVPQSFLNTFRLQVHLPRSQLFVLRVTSDVTLSEIMTHICTEKNLNMDKYEFRNPGNLDEVLELDKTLGDYKLQELSMMSKGNRTVTGLMSSADIINVKSSKHRQNSVCDSSLSSGSFGSRSASPIPPINVVTMPPQPPIRKKRRPAPKPPTFAENEKKDQTTGSVLISHSRESSDSSGYHEASVLSESPTHGSPASRIESDSPPDTLPRRSKLPPSQSFTNLTSIQPAPKSRLTNSVSNTSLNSNGYSRKKRAPPPPTALPSREDKIKSSTLPTSAAEDRRNNSNFTNETTFTHFKLDAPVEVSNAKVQNPVENTSELNSETKASKDEVPASLDVDVRLPPKPKPRTSIPKTPPKIPIQKTLHLKENVSDDLPSLNRWKNFENLAEEDFREVDFEGVSKKKENDTKGSRKSAEMLSKSQSEDVTLTRFGGKLRGCIANNVENSLLVGFSVGFLTAAWYLKRVIEARDVKEPSNEKLDANQYQTDNDSINWEYQLPPPPTDFRDTNSPSCTEFGTITITPEVLENVGVELKKEPNERYSSKTEKQINSQTYLKETRCNESTRNAQKGEIENHFYQSDKKFTQNKSVVMNELTNILNGNKKFKEKSLSVSNLYINESNPKDLKKNALNYSRSFSTEPVSSLENFKLSTYQTNGLGNNKKLFTSNELIYNNEITYRNYKNLEKSSSMECIQVNGADSYKIIDKTDDVFRKPVAPVQKKLKVAKRSASSVGVNSSNHKRSSLDVSQNGDWADEENISILRQQFLEFLKEKKLNSDLNMKSLEVIRNIIPELSGVEKESRNSCPTQVSVVINQSNGSNSQDYARSEEVKRKGEEKVKIVDVKVKNSLPVKETEKVILRLDAKKEGDAEVKREILVKSPEKKEDVTKRYSYQGPPSINFGTWGERPKTTKIIIKDEDYVTQEKVTEKKSEVANKNGDIPTHQKPKEFKKPAQIVIKKPGVLSRYEMFSALPKKKEVSSLELVHMEDEERKKKIEKIEAKEFSRVPVVCGMELKKEFKSPSPVKSNFSSPEPESETSKPKHSVSVYVNGSQEIERTPNYNYIVPKRNSVLMPVVKGFRPLEENMTSHINLSNHININLSSRNEPTHDSNGSPTKKQTNGPIPPPPPTIGLVKLKPPSSGSVKQKTISQDPRNQLLDEIRNFGGLRKLKRSTLH